MKYEKLYVVVIIVAISSASLSYLLLSYVPTDLQEAIEKGGLLENTTIGEYTYTVRGNVVTITHEEEKTNVCYSTTVRVTDFNGTIEKIIGKNPVFIKLNLDAKNPSIVKIFLFIFIYSFLFVNLLQSFHVSNYHVAATILLTYGLISLLSVIGGKMDLAGALATFSVLITISLNPLTVLALGGYTDKFSEFMNLTIIEYNPTIELVTAVFSVSFFLPALAFPNHLEEAILIAELMCPIVTVLFIGLTFDNHYPSMVISILILTMFTLSFTPAFPFSELALVGGEIGVLVGYELLKPRPVILMKKEVVVHKGRKKTRFVIFRPTEDEWEKGREGGINLATPEEHEKLESELKSRERFFSEKILDGAIKVRGYKTMISS